MQCQTAFAPSDRATPGRRRILLDSLRDLLGRMEDMRSNLAHSPAAPDIQDILNQSVVRNVYTETQNDLSLVFPQPPKPRPVEPRYSNDRRRVR
jgi:hypothetical protein